MIAVRSTSAPAPHPEHSTHAEVAPGHWVAAKPYHPRGVLGWQVRRACRKAGGHWWHPEPKSMIGWYCCACGTERDGMPRDGT